MSKIFDKSLIVDRIRAYWKRFVVLGTVFARRYRFDLFFRTEAKIVLLQTGFVFLVLSLVVAAIFFAYGGATQGLIYTSERDFFALGAVLVAVTAIFGYVVARLTLAPTRHALLTQKRFVSSIAHELRTPLSIMKTSLEVALLQSVLDPQLKNMLKVNVEEIDRISHTINNLLSMNSFVRPEQIVFTNVDLGKIASQALVGLQPLAEQRGITVVMEKGEYCMVRGSASALNQVITNILKNALIYTPPGGKVMVVIEPDYHGRIQLTIEDTGIGISQKDLESVFDPFYRVEYSRNRAFGGSGLGLAIVSELVRLHRGHISLRSVLGKGTTVSILLSCGSIETERKETKRTFETGEIAFDFAQS